MGLQSVVRWLLPKEDHFYDYLEALAATAHEAALAFAEFGKPDVTSAMLRKQIQQLEHRGDKSVHEMEEALAKTFVTPIDREDLQRLSSDIDSIVDLTNGAARACDLLGVDQPSKPMNELIEKLVRCTQVLKDTMPRLRRHEYTQLIEEARGLRTIEKEADLVFREAVSALFRDPNIDVKRLLREREVLEDLENAVDQCEHVAETLTHLAVKNG